MGQSEEQPGSAVTADDVATLAGVSRWTVNRAYRREASISEKSLKKVLDAAEKLGYVPDLSASSLASQRSNLVALLVDDFSNPHKLVVMERVTRILRKNGWDTLLVNTLDDDDTSTALLNVSQRRVDAAVLIGSRFNDQVLETALGARRVRKLIVFARSSKNENTISICCNDIAAMEKIADYVIAKGYRKPLFFAGPQTLSAHLKRKETFLNMWRDEGNEEPPHISVPMYDSQLAYDRISKYLSKLARSNWPDILVCENDALAMGAIDAIRYKFGLRVPEDMAVTGFDDVPQASSPYYLLTTYRQPITAMAEGMVEVLKGDPASTEYDKFEGHLVIRESA